jgi:hypothetical protein
MIKKTKKPWDADISASHGYFKKKPSRLRGLVSDKKNCE